VEHYDVLERHGLDLVLAGPDGGELPQLMELIEKRHLRNRVHYLGVVSDRTRNRLLQDAQMLLLPSYAEGLPTSALEALCAGTPTVLNSQAGNAILVKSAHGAIGFDLRSSTSYAVAVKQAADTAQDALFRQRIRTSNRAAYSWDALIPSVLRVYKEALA
jgi:glycosyltransferase involved in cell wall biosynthesis